MTQLRQGSDRHTLKDRKDDLYETPPEATLTLARHVRLPSVIWEPACGPGAIVGALRGLGHTVIAHDLVDYGNRACPVSTPRIDFLMETTAAARTIVTNPPFKLADQFVRHGLALGCEVIVLLRLMAIEGARRSDIVDRHCVQILAGKERLPMMHRDGIVNDKMRSAVPFAWFVFHPTPKVDDVIPLRRVSWRDG